MTPNSLQPFNFLDFGPFRLSLSERALYRSGEPVPLKPKEFELLSALVIRHGRLVTKEEILATVWPETTVEESNLSVHVSAIRRILGDSASDPVYIETVPRSGYRFRASVTRHVPANPPDLPLRNEGAAAEQHTADAPERERKAGRNAIPFSALAMAAIGGVAWLAWPSRSADSPSWKPIPLTSSPGLEVGPALSPDGSQVLYSVFARGADGHPDRERLGVWLKKLGGTSEPERLTDQSDFNPAWSPDGREIAFVRYIHDEAKDEDHATVVVRSAFGGSDRILRSLNYTAALPGPSVQYTPDGKWILTSTGTGFFTGAPPRRLVAISVETGETRNLFDPPPASAGDSNPAISPRGDRLAFCRCSSTNACDLYSVAMSNPVTVSGSPQRLTQVPSAEFRPLFLPDQSVLYSMGPPETRTLWRTKFDWTGKVHSHQVSSSDEDVVQPTVAKTPEGKWRLVYVRNMVDTNIWRQDLDAPDGKPAGAPMPFISSTRVEETPAYSPDGQRIAFASNRSGQWEIWSCLATGRNCTQMTHMGPAYSRAPSWSPDGKWLAFDSRPSANPQIFVMNSTGAGPVRVVTSSAYSSVDPVWSPDGKWLHFGSNRSGRFEIYRTANPLQEAGESVTEQVSTTGGATPRLTSDGGTLLFRGPGQAYYRMQIATQSVERLPSGIQFIGPPVAGPSSLAYGFTNTGLQGYLSRVHLDTGAVEPLVKMSSLTRSAGIARSPDGRQLLFVQSDRNESDLMMVEDLPH